MSLNVNTISVPVSTILLILAGICLIPQAFAHSPVIPDNNSRLESAAIIPDPTKSWAIYGKLHGSREAQYYRFNMSKGQRIHIMLLKSTNPDDRKFIPSFALMGQGISSRGSIPGYLELPSGVGILAVEGEQPARATYEPFSASSFYTLAELDMEAPEQGTYFIAVYEPDRGEPNRGGSYGLAIGDREEYSLSEWILIPLALISIYRWEGQDTAVILLPLMAVLVAGLALIIPGRSFTGRRFKSRLLFWWTGLLAGFMFVGSGVMLLYQMIISLTRAPAVSGIAITVILALLPVLSGIAVIRIATRDADKIGIRDRIYLATLGIFGFFIWAGLLIGPALAILASIMPARAGIRSL